MYKDDESCFSLLNRMSSNCCMSASQFMLNVCTPDSDMIGGVEGYSKLQSTVP